jgi:hypothetical protein
MRLTVPLGALVLGVVIPLASCATPGMLPVRPPEEIWLAAPANLDDLRDAPGGRAITDWRLQGCTGFPPDHVPSGFVARHVGDPGGPLQTYTATGAKQEHDRRTWWQYRLSR